MEQPYPLPKAAKIDFSFDATELIAVGDEVSTAVLTPSSNITVSSESIVSCYANFFAEWSTTPSIGDTGYVEALITSTSGRVLPKRMTFFATESL